MTWQPPDGDKRVVPHGREPASTKRVLGIRPAAWLAIGITVVVIAVVAALNPDEDPASSFDNNAYSAHAACAEFTRDRLKSPSSADFPEYDDQGVNVTRRGDEWTVVSFVDADNSFGANIRTDFVCVVSDQGDTWRLEAWSEP